MATDTNTCFECGRHLYSFAEITRLRERERVLREALSEQHEWHLGLDETYAVPDGEGGWVPLNKAEEYCDSAMYERTQKALAATQPDAPEADGDKP